MDILLTVAQVFVFLYDVVTYPIYQVVTRIYAKQEEKKTTPRAYMVKESSEEISWRRDKSNDNAVYKDIIIDNKVLRHTCMSGYIIVRSILDSHCCYLYTCIIYSNKTSLLLSIEKKNYYKKNISKYIFILICLNKYLLKNQFIKHFYINQFKYISLK